MRNNKDSLQILDVSNCFTGSSNVKLNPGLTKWKVMIEESRNNKEKLIEISSMDDPLYEKYKSFIHKSCFPENEEILKSYGLNNCIRIMPQDCDTSKLRF